jgi:hypothetical protein
MSERNYINAEKELKQYRETNKINLETNTNHLNIDKKIKDNFKSFTNIPPPEDIIDRPYKK